MKINVRKYLVVLTTPPAFIVSATKKVKAWNKTRLAKKVIPELSPHVLYELIMKDFINDRPFQQKLLSYFENTKQENGSAAWTLDIAVILRNWFADNTSRVEDLFRKKGKKTAKIALVNSEKATRLVVEYFLQGDPHHLKPNQITRNTGEVT